ncbi:MAG: TonB-dependent receptor, partial [Gammaproteobacteria bacterium]|nr:TonB-dependent receptor [Gammaproteobacteria bacterium]
VYLTMARGYKAGGFNIGSVVPVDRREFDAELLDSIELGYKFFDATRGLRYELAAFHMRRREQQVSTSAQLDPGDPLSFIYLTDNAARGVNEGLEGSLSTALGERWRLGATLGLLRTRFVDYVVAGQDLSGRGQAHAPRHQASISLEYEHPRGWFARADAQQVAAFFFSDSHAQRSRPYCLVNLRAGYALERWRAEFWVRNALDENYAMRGFFFGNEPPDFPDRLYVQLAEPRTLGLTVNWKVR